MGTTVFRNVQVFDGSGTVPFTGSVTVVTTLFGFSPNEALVAATRHGGELMDLPVGQIRPGYLADLLLVDGDPTTDITILQDRSRLMAIMKDGALHKPPPTRDWRPRQDSNLRHTV